MIRKRVDLSCDFPDGGYGHCMQMLWVYSSRETEARTLAARGGWLRVEGHDFCGIDPDMPDVPTPNHAQVLAGHPFTPQSHTDGKGGGRRHRPACGCGWVCPDDAVHLWVSASHGAQVGQRSLAAKLWAEIHVREDVAGLGPKWTRAALDKLEADRTARMQALGL